MKDVSQYVREYSNNSIFDVPANDPVITIIGDDGGEISKNENLTPGHWFMFFTPFQYHYNHEENSPGIRRHLFIYNTAIEEKVSNKIIHEDLHRHYSSFYSKGINIKVGNKIIKVVGIDTKEILIELEENTNDLIVLTLYDENIDDMITIAQSVISDLKVRRALSQLWEYFPNTLVKLFGDHILVIYKVPIDKARAYGIFEESKDSYSKYVNITNEDKTIIMWPYFSYRESPSARLKADSKQTEDVKNIHQIMDRIIHSGIWEEKDLYIAYFIRIINYLYHNKIEEPKTLWIDDDGKMYIVNDVRTDDNVTSNFIDRWDPTNPLNRLKTGEIHFTPISA